MPASKTSAMPYITIGTLLYVRSDKLSLSCVRMRWEEVGIEECLWWMLVNHQQPSTSYTGKDRVEILHVGIQMYCQLDDAQLARL